MGIMATTVVTISIYLIQWKDERDPNLKPKVPPVGHRPSRVVPAAPCLHRMDRRRNRRAEKAAVVNLQRQQLKVQVDRLANRKEKEVAKVQSLSPANRKV